MTKECPFNCEAVDQMRRRKKVIANEMKRQIARSSIRQFMTLISITGSLIVCGFYRQTYFIFRQINNDITMSAPPGKPMDDRLLEKILVHSSFVSRLMCRSTAAVVVLVGSLYCVPPWNFWGSICSVLWRESHFSSLAQQPLRIFHHIISSGSGSLLTV